MSDWPPAAQTVSMGGVIHTGSTACLVSDVMAMTATTFTTAAAWPAANRALYMPFMVEQTLTAYKMAFEVGAQAGNYDVGIYDELGNRLVSKGSTTVPAVGLAVVDITDTVLTPGTYYMAMNCDTVTTLTVMRSAPVALAVLQMAGLQQQAVGAVTLPDPAVFANPATAYVPSLSVALKATI